MKNIIIFNGSINGNQGNTEKILQLCSLHIEKLNLNCEIIHLNQFSFSKKLVQEKLLWADGFIFATGTYWDSWGSPLQKFLEELTIFEATPELLFKPCATIVTMHGFGGKEILSRLQGVLNTMGLLIPPMSGLVYGLAIQEALKHSEDFSKDFWSIDDLEIVLHNLKTALYNKSDYQTWPVDHKDPKRQWIKLN